MSFLKCCLLLLTFFAVNTALAQRHIIQIGGGDELQFSQGQIERNVLWLNELFTQRNEKVTNFFAAGAKTNIKDVVYLDHTAEASLLEPLRRVFVDGTADFVRYKQNEVPQNSGTTKKEELVDSLGQIMKSTQPDDELFIIYNGHGDVNPADTRNNPLRLWGKTRMSVEEFDAILDQAPQQATVRFIFPQCFSGAFHNLVYENVRDDDLAQQNRCGFLAHSPFHESEGCTLSINEENFRDYTTYYFAALSGKTRQKKQLISNPDLNNDGQISYREAHLYVLRNSSSKDLPRATSEVFLQRWQPWYLKWMDAQENTQSIYWQIAEHIAQRHNIDLDPASLHQEYSQITLRWDALKTGKKSIQVSIKTLQESLQKSLQITWPVLAGLPPDNFRSLSTDQVARINAALNNNPEYAELKKQQDKLLKLENRIHFGERMNAVFLKIKRYRHLARLEKQFATYASVADQRAYLRLLACENGILGAAASK